MTVNEIVSTYPKTINYEQLRIILGISKRKCAWMLQNGGAIEKNLLTERTRKAHRLRAGLGKTLVKQRTPKMR